jgi:prephenate dehydratase
MKKKNTSAAPKERVAFQGERGAFSQVAVQQLMGGDCDLVPCQWFDAVFKKLSSGEAEAAVVPIENTLHGSVHENYDHLLQFDDMRIVGETSVRIVHNLIAPPGTAFSQVRRAYSHPVALNQCIKFFEQHPEIERVPFYDTAGSVKMLMEDRPAAAAAIASSIAADVYGARILKRSIEDDRKNFTRFFLLRRRDYPVPALPPPARRGWKTSLVFTTRNQPGSLFRSLSAFALRDLSLAKIESRPLRGKPWEYLFYLDFLGDVNEDRCQKALGHLAELADFLRVLGCYPCGD